MDKLIICLVCLLIIGTILISGCTQFQSDTSINNTTGPKPNLSSGSEDGPPTPPESSLLEEEVRSISYIWYRLK